MAYDYEDTLHAWERRGNAIYTQGKMNQDGYVAGSAELVIDFGHVLHVDDIDRIIMAHNNALDAFASEMEQRF